MNTANAADGFDIEVSQATIEGSKCPWHLHNQLRERGQVVSHSRPGTDKPAYAITDYESVVAGLQEPRFVKNPQAAMAVFGDIETAKRSGFVLTNAGYPHLLNTDPPDHTRLRRLVAGAFAPRRIVAMTDRIQGLVDSLLDELEQQNPADLVEGFAYQLSITMICEILGVPTDRRAEFREWSVLATTPPGEDASANMKAAATLHAFLAEHIAQQREQLEGVTEKNAPNVLASMIVARQADDRLSDEELVGMAFLLLIAGHETTVGLISSMALGLARHPEQRQKLIDDPELIENAVEEFLRWDGPVQRSTFRVSTEDVVIGDGVVPQGSLVTMHIGGANHDPAAFENPHELDIERELERHVAFGQGVHFCLGAPLARLEAAIAVGTLVRRFPDYEVLVSDEDLHYQSTVVRALATLPARLVPVDTNPTS